VLLSFGLVQCGSTTQDVARCWLLLLLLLLLLLYQITHLVPAVLLSLGLVQCGL
jgi:hypothetical protein